MPKTSQTHKATRIKKGFYMYRGYFISSFDQKYLLDSDLKNVVWEIRVHPDANSIGIEDSFAMAKWEVDRMICEKTQKNP